MISACIVTFNSLEDIKAALDSIAKTQAAVFVVDNQSTDGTPEWVKQNYPQITLIQSAENKGFGAGNNQVLELLNSKYHVMMNPDVTIEADLLERMAAFMDAHPEVVLLSPRVVYPDGTEQFLPKKRPSLHYLAAGMLEKYGPPFTDWRKKYTGQDAVSSEPREVDFATGCFMFVRTDAFKKIGGFDESFFMYMEDADLTLRMKKEGKVLYHPDFVVTHAWKRESHSNPKLKKMHMDSIKRFFKKWGLRM